jgi:uncharacterized sulfatase
MISLMDHHIGRILDALEETGQRQNTLVIFTSDHGDMLGDHGFWWKGFVPYEEHMRVPLIVSLPGNIPAGTATEALQSLLDLPPTILSYAGVPVPEEMQGVDQRPAWENHTVPVRESVIVEERLFHSDWGQDCLITPTHKLCFYANRDYGELYDLVEDPNQIENLWDRPRQATLKQELLRSLLSEQITRLRPRFVPQR